MTFTTYIKKWDDELQNFFFQISIQSVYILKKCHFSNIEKKDNSIFEDVPLLLWKVWYTILIKGYKALKGALESSHARVERLLTLHREYR